MFSELETEYRRRITELEQIIKKLYAELSPTIIDRNQDFPCKFTESEVKTIKTIVAEKIISPHY